MVDIKSLTYEELEEYIVQLGESRYRAGQIFKALANGLSISEMTNLSKALRSRLCEECIDTAAVINRDSKSRDGTRKFLYGFADGDFYGRKDARLWMPSRLLKTDSVQANYIAMRGKDSLYLAFCNQSKRW